MYKDVVKRILAGFLTVCMIAGTVDLSAFTVRAADKINENDYWRCVYSQSEEYTGSEIKPTVAVYPMLQDGSYSTTALTEGTDYDLTYENNKVAGNDAVVYVEGKEGTDYAGASSKLIFAIKKKSLGAEETPSAGIEIDPIADQSYTGGALTPPVVVKHNGNVLRGALSGSEVTGEKYDYIYTYQNNVEEGKATVRIDGQGNYTGTVSTSFAIIRHDASKLEVTIKNPNRTYTGSPIEPETIVTYDGNTLVKDTDYAVSYSNNINAGKEAAVTVVGISTAYVGMSKTVKFAILKDIAHDDIKVEFVADKVYTGAPIELTADDIVIKDGEKTLVFGQDYELTDYEENTKLGTASFTIQGLNIYKQTRPASFNITPVTMKDMEIKVASCIYNGEEQKPAVTVSRGSDVYDPSTYNVIYRNNVNAGVETAIAVVTGTGSLSGSVEIPFTIEPKPLSEVSINALPAGLKYTGGEIKPNVILTDTIGAGAKKLVLNKDYTIKYTNCINAGQAMVTMTGMGNYIGTKTGSYNIEPIPLNDAEISTIADQIYTGSPITPGIRVTLNGELLGKYSDATKRGDYTVEYTNNENAGEATITVRGCGNYTGEKETAFTILKKQLTSTGITVSTIPPQMYTGDIWRPGVTVRYNGMTLGENDIEVTYGDKTTNINVGTNTGVVTITALDTGNYEGSITKYFSITPRDIRTGELRTENLEKFYHFTGSAIEEAKLEIYYANASAGISESMLGSEDYTVTYSGNLAIGTAAITITGKGNYTGSKVFAFGIKGNLEDSDMTSVTIPSQIYTGSAIEPTAIAVRFNNVVLKKGTDYNITFNDNTEVGWAEAVVEGIGNYTGTVTQVFEITKKDLSTVTEADKNFVVSGIEAGYEYTGFPIVPKTTITYYNQPLEETVDYEAEYSDNENIGKASVEITGKEPHFIDSLTRQFDIRAYDIGQENSDVTLSGVVEEVVWDVANSKVTEGTAVENGKVVQKQMEVTFRCTNPADSTAEDRVLTEGKDYNVSYETNDKIGRAAVVITGMGNFTGTIRKEFAIRGDLSKTSIANIADWQFVPALAGEDYRNTPKPVVTYMGVVLKEGEDYSVSYEDNGQVGTAKAVISEIPDGNYVGTNSKEFTIVPRELSVEDTELVITGLLEEGYEYTGSEIVPDLTVTYSSVELTAADIEITAKDNVDVPVAADEDTPAPQPTVILKAKENGNYAGEIVLPFTINPRKVSADTIRVEGLDPDGYPYDPANVMKREPAVSVYYGDETAALIEDKDYTIAYADNEYIGKATITVTGKNNYAGVLDTNFYIWGNLAEADVENGYITVAEVEPAPYGIVAVYPKLTIIDKSSGEEKVLVQGENELVTAADGEMPEADFVITKCENNINVASKDSANPPTVTLEGRGAYRGTITRTFDIVAKDLTTDEGDITATFEGSIDDEEIKNAFKYTGEEIAPEVTIYNHGVPMTPGVDYVVREYVNNVEVPDKDTPQESYPGVVIDAVENGNYIGSKTLYFNIIPRDISDMKLTIVSGEAQTFDRTEKKPEVMVTYVQGEEECILEAENYEVTYQNNISVAAANAETAPTVTVTGKGNFGGSVSRTFTIVPEDVAETNTDIVAEAQGGEYTGEAVMPTVEVKAADGTVLEEGTDYSLGTVTGNINAGTGYIAVSGMGNYTGNRQVPFTVTAKEMAAEDIVADSIPTQNYTGGVVTPKLTVAFKEVKLAEGTDYTVSYRNHINAGTAYAVISGKGNYGGHKEVPFVIAKKSIGNGTIESEMTLSPISDQLYTGKGVVPVVELTYQNKAAGTSQKLIAGRDYNINCTSNVSVGTASAVISGIGNYSGTIRTTFRIQGNMLLAEVGEIAIQRYTGGAITPQPEVRFAGKTLVKDTDYSLEYGQNIQRGTASITITGKDLYRGSKTVYFTIAAPFSAGLSVTGAAAAYTYTGSDITPTVRVSDYGRVLTKDRDYRVTYKNNGNVGTATLTVTGMGEFIGSKQVTYKIVERNIAQSSVSSIKNQNYTGKAIKPAVKVVNNGKTLKEGTDYKIVYVNNVKPGKASVIIKGKNNFIGTKTLNFNIVIPKVAGLSQSKAATNAVTLSWKKNSAVTGYEIYTSDNKLVARVKNSVTSYKVSGLKKNKTYTYKVRAYVTKDGETKRGVFTSLKTTTAPAATKITSISSSKSKQIVLKWSKVSGAAEYAVYRSTGKNGRYSCIGTTKKTNYTDKKATGGKTYYYKVRVRKTLDKKNYYSSYSTIAAKRAKK